ncbi:TIGR01777 family oxidoreductase [Robertkochia flava]|uniref:TIGR01777 family oxidoreductase n=1 Tax=Robertkochia flava TaxID=3447986 RepID=UPI001CCE39D3|nr:TIGR01777 family oxidoreductase [Robertkochia marina]
MRILITGATGLVGSAISALCMEKGHEVFYLTTSKDKISGTPNYKGFYWNPSENEIDTSCFQGVDAIINLAGSSVSRRWTSSYKQVIRDSRVNSLDTLFTGLKRSGEKVASLVSASAIGYYPSSLTNYYEEDTHETAASFLGEVVRDWEQAADQFTALEMQVAKVRIGLVLSMDGGALPEMVKPVRYYAGAAFGSGEQWQSWIHINDLASVFLHLLENEFSGIYNGVAPNPVTQNKLIQGIAGVLGKPLLLPNIPKWAVEALLGEMSSVLLESQRVSSKKIEASGYHFIYPNLLPALKDLINEKGQLREELAS